MLRLATFPEAPLRSRTVGFPESGSGLGSVPISQGAPSPTARNCGAGAPFAPTRWSLHRPFATTQAPRNPAQSPERTQLSWPPSAQSPFARSGRYPRRGGLASRLEGRYPLVVARTGSCARPSPSPRLRIPVVRAVFAGCRQSLLRDGPSRHYLRDPCVGARTSTPPRSQLHMSASSPGTSASPHRRRVRRARLPPHGNFGGDPISRLQSFDHLRAPTLARPPGCSHRGSTCCRAAGPFTPRTARPVTRTGMWRRYMLDTDD